MRAPAVTPFLMANLLHQSSKEQEIKLSGKRICNKFIPAISRARWRCAKTNFPFTKRILSKTPSP